MSSAEVLISGKTKMPLSNRFKNKQISSKMPISDDCDYDHVLTKMPYFWELRLWSQPSQNDRSHTSKDYDRRPHKMHYLCGPRPWSQFSQSTMFLSLYRIAVMITILFIRTATMIAVFTKMSYIWVFMSIATMICPKRELWLQFSQNALFLVFVRIATMIAVLPNILFLSQSS